MTTLADFLRYLQRTSQNRLRLFLGLEGPTDFFAWLEECIRGLERNAKNYSTLQETGISAVLCQSLHTPAVGVTQEENSNGHVDLTITISSGGTIQVMLGEAKIYDGYARHVDGLEQLISRYSTGRSSTGFVFEYVKKRDIKGLMGGLREEMDRQMPIDQVGATRDHAMKWSFVSSHLHSSGEKIDVHSVGVNLYC